MLTLQNAHYAAMINLGSNPLISLIILVIVVGIVVWVALYIFDTFLAGIIAEPFAKFARALIWIIGLIIVIDAVLKVVFGIAIFG